MEKVCIIFQITPSSNAWQTKIKLLVMAESYIRTGIITTEKLLTIRLMDMEGT